VPKYRGQSVGVRELKARASELLRELGCKGGGVVITRHGKPCAKLVPFKEARAASGQRPLRNAYPHLPALTEEDFLQAKRTWWGSFNGN